VFVLIPNVCTYTWTTPNDPRAYCVQVYVQRAGDPCSTAVAAYYGRQDDGLTDPTIKPGRIDSLYITLPAHSDSVRYNLWHFVSDSLGVRRWPKSKVTSWLMRKP
jgi:hypothetical protein